MTAKPVPDGAAPVAMGDSGFPRMERARERLVNPLSLGAARKPSLLALFAPFLAWRERNFAAARCREMLALYWTIAARHPGLTGPHLYRKVVAARGTSAGLDADAVLDCAEQGFAEWPVSRELKFRDVVHCLTVLEFFDTHRDASWIQANLRLVVNGVIPSQL